MSDVDNVTDSPRETRSGVPLSSPLPKTIQKPEVRRPRRWKKKWVKVSHMQLLKWVPGLFASETSDCLLTVYL